jgi:FtsP/CotA-like multicopper oxidase with cupredoxin domain
MSAAIPASMSTWPSTTSPVADSAPSHSGTNMGGSYRVAVVTILTVLALALGVANPATQVNLALSAEDVGGLVTPPSMIMGAETAAVRTEAPPATRGDQPLPPRLEAGVKVSDLSIAATGPSILPDRRVEAYAANGQVPAGAARDRGRPGARDRPQRPTGADEHSLARARPAQLDGRRRRRHPAAIAPRETFTYEFTAARLGSYFYHSHAAADRQQSFGLYGALIIDPADPATDPAGRYDHDPGERYDVVWEAREPGRWLLHCHIPHHTTNDNVEVDGASGLTAVIEVTP